METMKKIISIILCLVTLFSVVTCTGVYVSAAAKGTDPYSVGTYPTRDLFYKKGSTVKTGKDVKWVQQVLVNSGISVDVDGSFGPATKEAVKKFQKANDLDVDGSCGPKTRAAMKKWVENNPKLNGKNSSTEKKATSSSTSTSKTLKVDMSLIKKTGYQPESGPCGCYALAYCRDIIDGEAHSWTEYSNEGYVKAWGRYGYTVNWSKGGFKSKTGSNKQAVLKALYDSINNEKPAVVRVKGNGSTGHYVAVVGYKNVTDVNKLSEKNFLIIDSASKTAFNRGITSMTSGSTGYSIHSNRQYAIAK